MLVLFVIGTIDPKLLGVAKRVKEYRPSDYDLVYTYVALFSEVVLLPNIVSETSYLLNYLKGERRELCMERLALLAKGSSEQYVASVFAMEQPEYMALGVADAAVLCALEDDTYLRRRIESFTSPLCIETAKLSTSRSFASRKFSKRSVNALRRRRMALRLYALQTCDRTRRRRCGHKGCRQ